MTKRERILQDTLITAIENLLNYANNYSDAMAMKYGKGAQELGSFADSVSVAGMARAAIASALHGSLRP